jgi:hypothetical protein
MTIIWKNIYSNTLFVYGKPFVGEKKFKKKIFQILKLHLI